MFHHDKGPYGAPPAGQRGDTGMPRILAAWRRKRQLFADAIVDNIKPHQCLLCLGRSTRHCLCPDCLADLPWLGRACAGCALPLADPADDSGADHCADCRREPPPWRQAGALFRYEFPLDRLVAALKYHGRLALAATFASLMADQCPPGAMPDLLLPVPLHPRRLRQRGYHQTALLATAMARRLGARADCHGLVRLRDTAMQKTLDSEARLANLRDVFAWRGGSLAGRRVMLIDDVMTTGATLRALCPGLLAAGAASVDVMVVARTLPP